MKNAIEIESQTMYASRAATFRAHALTTNFRLGYIEKNILYEELSEFRCMLFDVNVVFVYCIQYSFDTILCLFHSLLLSQILSFFLYSVAVMLVVSHLNVDVNTVCNI